MLLCSGSTNFRVFLQIIYFFNINTIFTTFRCFANFTMKYFFNNLTCSLKEYFRTPVCLTNLDTIPSIKKQRTFYYKYLQTSSLSSPKRTISFPDSEVQRLQLENARLQKAVDGQKFDQPFFLGDDLGVKYYSALTNFFVLCRARLPDNT